MCHMWSSHMADFPKGMVMMRPRTPELAALAIQQLLDRDVDGRPILVKDRGLGHGGFPVNVAMAGHGISPR